MLNLKSQWAKLPPSKQRILAVVAIVAAVLAVIAVVQTEPTKEEKYIAKRDQVSNVFTNSNTRNQTLDHLAGQLKQLRETNELLVRRLEKLENKDIQPELNKLSSEFQEKINEQQLAMRELAESYNKQETPATPEQKPETQEANQVAQKNATRHTRQSATVIEPVVEQPTPKPVATSNNVFDVTPPTQEDRQSVKRDRQPLKLSVMSEATEEVKPQRGKKKAVTDSESYIPAGSILTGTILTGGEFPTNKGAFDNPTPILIRLSKDAILPNRYRSDVRECFLIAGGAGDLASERAKVRGETLSCVRHDGSVIESKLESYVAGEDGKAGIKGRLVSKQGQIIARSLVAGFAGGMSEAFDVDPVPVLATTSTGETQYQDAFSANAVQGAAVKGMSKSLDRIAQFYLDMAEDVFPVVEVNAGRQVDIVVISGTTLKISAKGSLSKK